MKWKIRKLWVFYNMNGDNSCHRERGVMMTIEGILAGESKNVEFKENLPEKSIKYMQSVVAFANGTGGKIIFGIADKTREVVGFDKEDVFKKMDAIRELIINAMVHRSYLDHGTIQVAVYDNRLEITSPGKLLMGQTIERMKEGYSKIRNEALAHAFAYMNLIEHWGSGIPRIIDKVKAAGLREPEFIGGEVDLRINIYRGQVATNNAMINANGTKNGANGVKCGVDDGTNSAEVPLNKEQTQIEKLLQIIEKNPSATQAYYAEKMGISKRTVSRMFASLQEKGRLVQGGTKRKANWKIIR